MTADEIREAIATLRRQLGTGVARAKYDGREVEYRSTADISAAIANLERELAALENRARPRVTFAQLGRGR